MNPSGGARSLGVPALNGRTAAALEASGAGVTDGRVDVGPFGYGVFLLDEGPAKG